MYFKTFIKDCINKLKKKNTIYCQVVETDVRIFLNTDKTFFYINMN